MLFVSDRDGAAPKWCVGCGYKGRRAMQKKSENKRASKRVLIVDDAAPFRQAVRELLERRGYVVVGEAASAASALAEAARVRPDAVLLDVHLRDGSGLDVCTTLCSSRPAPAVLLVSMYDLPGSGRHVAASGARGFVLKSELASMDFGEFWPTSTR